MASLNRVSLIGHLGRDPETRRTQSGNAIVNLRVATSESWKDKASGEWKERTEWHSVVVFNEHLTKAAEKLRKGSQVYVEGQLQTRKWTDQSGAEKYTTEIVLQAFRGELKSLDKAERQDGDRVADRAPDRGAAPMRGGYASDLDDDIPFSPEMRG